MMSLTLVKRHTNYFESVMGSGGSICMFSLPHQIQVQVNKNFIKTKEKKTKQNKTKNKKKQQQQQQQQKTPLVKRMSHSI